jgi:hypothetical protein
MTLEELQTAIQKQATAGSLTFKQMSSASFGFFLVSISVPFASDISLPGATVSAPSGGTFTVQGTGTWGLVDGVGATVTFKTDQDDIVADLVLQMPPTFSLSIPSVDWLALNQVSLDLKSAPAPARRNPLVPPVAGAIGAVITVAHVPVPIKIGMEGSGDWFVEGDFENIDFPSLSDLLSFAGNTDDINLPATLSNLPRIALYDVLVAFNPTTKTVSSVGVTFGSSANSTTGWELLPGVFTIESFKIVVSVINPTDSASRGIGGSVGAQLKLGGTEIDVYAAHPPTGGWDFQGETKKDQPVDLGKLLDDLMSKFGVTIPASLKSLTLKNFVIEFNTLTGAASCAFTLDFTVSDTPVELSASLKLTQQNGKYTPDLKGTLIIGSSTFVVTFHETTLSAEWSLATGAQPLEFGDLAKAFGFKDPPAVPSSLDLALTEASFTYDFGTGELILTAISKNFGKAIFIVQKGATTTLFAFGLNVHLGVTLADIPLVGDKLPDAENLGIPDAGVWVLSQPVLKTQAEQLNKTIKALGADNGLPTLPDADTTATVLLSADLELGVGNTTPLQLALGGQQTQSQSGQPAASPQAGTTPANQTTATPSINAPAPTTAVTPTAQTPATTDNTKWLNIEKQFGVFQFKRIGINYQNDSLFFALDSAITMGPLTFSLDGLSIGSPLTRFDPKFDLTGLGVAYVKPPLEIMGGLLKIPGSQLAPNVDFQFDGVLVMKGLSYSLSAIGSYAQTHSDPSLFVFAQLEAALGGPPFFFVTGLMAGFGFNRSLSLPAQDEVLDFPLLALAQPPSPGEKVQQQDPMHVLDVLEGRAPITTGGETKQWIAPSTGAYWLAVGIEFTSFELVSSKALLIVEFGNDFQVTLLGLSTMRLPQAGDQLYAYVELQLRAVFQPQAGFFGLTAILSSNSFVIDPACHLTGGFAFYLWFGNNPNAGQFVITLGGYHPAFKPPDYFPVVPRLGFNWAVSDVVSVSGDAYFALTTSCVMAGGGLEVLFHDGDLRAWFTAHADILISWHPFFFIADIDVEIGVSYRLNLLFCHKTISISIGASVNMWGPPTGGNVHVHLWVVSFTVHFGSDSAGAANDPLDWSGFKNLLPQPNDVCKVTVSDGLYKSQDSTTSNSGQAWIVRAANFKFFTQSTIPSNQLAYGGSQARQTEAAENSGINIRPMNLTAVTSNHSVNVYKDLDTAAVAALSQGKTISNPQADVSNWNFQPRQQNLPESLWGAPPAKFTQIPDTPTANVITDQPVGYDVQAPQPVIGSSQGLIQLTEVSEDYVLPPSNSPVSPTVAASPDYLPSFNNTTVAEIKQIMTGNAITNRDSLFNELQAAGIYKGTNGTLINMAAQAAHIFSDSPMQQS